jgi:phycoerythrobilin:ferredoxin oxidoreductase
MEAFDEHLDIYLDLVLREQEQQEERQPPPPGEKVHHHQEEYIRYRLENDPARPMLRSLFGEEWTERVLENVLFPRKL